jgi:2-amino-4-hydroxy-6-hydroxymethyldihydropteridine diphosphokinase
VTRTAYLGLGSNLGDRGAHLRAAVEGLREDESVRVVAVSPVYETEAHTVDPTETQPDFFNAVVEVEVSVAPERLLDIVQAIERAEGRTRKEGERWTPRPLDIDLLVVGEEVCRTDRLTLPHPRLAERRFVLRPWADLAPSLVVPPPFNDTVQALLSACPDDIAFLRRVECSINPDG